MTESEVFEAITGTGISDFSTLVRILEEHRPWCLVGGLAVNCYVEPVYSLDISVVVASSELSAIQVDLIFNGFSVDEFKHSVIARTSGSQLRIHLTLDQRYQKFLVGTTTTDVFGQKVSVGSLENIVQGKIWSWSDPERPLTKRKKDELDLIRIAESYPELRNLMPSEIREQLDIV